jgi:hypothetical protein
MDIGENVLKPKFKFRNPILGYFPEMASGDIASHELLAQKHLFLVKEIRRIGAHKI